MTISDENLTRYLFGELSESELAELEQRYFAEPQIFDRLLQQEAELVDSYARGRLAAPVRARFERAYGSDPNRRTHLRFAEALTSRLDQSPVRPQTDVRTLSWWQKLNARLGINRRSLAFAVMLAMLFLSAIVVWLLIRNARLRHDLDQSREIAAAQKQREDQAQQALANEQSKNQQLTAEIEKRNALEPQPTPTNDETASPVIASLILTAAGVRGADYGTAPKLVIPSGTQQVRIELRLKETGYTNYQLILQDVQGKQIFNRPHVKPALSKTGARFVLTLTPALFSPEDYILTVKGTTAQGETEDVSQSLFRVEKQ